ncbi:hypothetical protein AVEN_262961-1 [Araneus ventricosus]|uniref:Uncharacterized protein n=1 Tax=Araneus ventricosus TaxID=182803 RepID=A0A4Y2DG76_ARAVE|nr:hypothetical protein AVEN_262961-1 [Araneus ventricosus]
MDLSLCLFKDSTLSEPHSVLVGENQYTNSLYSLPHILLPYGTTQPTTSASMVPQSSQQFNVKKEDIICSTFSREKPVFSVQIPINWFFFVPSIVFSVESNAFVNSSPKKETLYCASACVKSFRPNGAKNNAYKGEKTPSQSRIVCKKTTYASPLLSVEKCPFSLYKTARSWTR